MGKIIEFTGNKYETFEKESEEYSALLRRLELKTNNGKELSEDDILKLLEQMAKLRSSFPRTENNVCLPGRHLFLRH